MTETAKVEKAKPPELPTSPEDTHVYEVTETTAWWVIRFVMQKTPVDKGGKRKKDKSGKEAPKVPSAVMRDEYAQFKKKFPEVDFKVWTLEKFFAEVEKHIIEHLGEKNRNGSWRPNLKDAETYVRAMCKMTVAKITNTEPPEDAKKNTDELPGNSSSPDPKDPKKPNQGGSGTTPPQSPTTPHTPSSPASPTPPAQPTTPTTPSSPDEGGTGSGEGKPEGGKPEGGETKPEGDPAEPEVVPPLVDPKEKPGETPDTKKPTQKREEPKPEDKSKFRTKKDFDVRRGGSDFAEALKNTWEAITSVAYEVADALLYGAEQIASVILRALEIVIEALQALLNVIYDLFTIDHSPSHREPGRTRWWATFFGLNGISGVLAGILYLTLGWTFIPQILLGTMFVLSLWATIESYINDTD